MKKLHLSFLAILLCLLALPNLGFGSRNFLTDPNIDQGYLVWPKSNQPNVTYRLRLAEKNLRGQTLRVKMTQPQTENYFHFDNKMIHPDKRITAQLRAYVNGSMIQAFPPIEILPEAPGGTISTLQCSWDCPGNGYTIDAYELTSSGGNTSYVMELMPSSPSYYHYMNYSTWVNGPFFPFIDELHVINLGNVSISDGYCQGGVALSGAVVGVRIENPYGVLQTNPFFGTSPCVLASGVLQAGLIVEQNCANCPPNLDIDCRASDGCIGGGSSSSSSGGSNGSPYDATDSLFFDWIYDLLDAQLDFATNLENQDVISDLLDYDEVSHVLTAFAHRSFANKTLRSVVRRVSLTRLDDPSVAPFSYNVLDLDRQNRNNMRFNLDFSQKPAGLYTLSILLNNGRHFKRIFKHTPKASSKQTSDLFANETPSLELYPNPATTRLTVNVSNTEGPADIRIIDLNGRLQMERHIEIDAVQQATDLSLEQFTPGIYFLELIANGHKEVQKFIVQ